MIEEEVDGVLKRRVKPYIIDLGAANGTYVNNERIDSQRFVSIEISFDFWKPLVFNVRYHVTTRIPSIRRFVLLKDFTCSFVLGLAIKPDFTPC